MPQDNTADFPSIAELLTRSIAALPALGNRALRSLVAGVDAALFFPSYGDTGEEAPRICASCPVRTDCLQYATEADELGIWGGLDRHERRELLRRVP